MKKRVLLIIASLIALLIVYGYAFAQTDSEKPVIDIDGITYGDCTIIIPVTDNQGVDAEATKDTIVMLDEDLIDVTDRCILSYTGDGDNETTITIDVSDSRRKGIYLVTMTAYDINSNMSAEEEMVISVTYCGKLTNPPSCRGLTPLYVVAGSRSDIEISGKNTNFDNSTIVSFACGTIIQNDLITVSSDEKIIMNVTVMDNAVDSDPCEVTVTTGSESINCEEFAVLEEAPCLLISTSPPMVISGLLLPRLVMITIKGNSDCLFDVTNASVISGNSYLMPIMSVPAIDSVIVLAVVWPGAERGSTASLVVAGADNYIDIPVQQGILP